MVGKIAIYECTDTVYLRQIRIGIQKYTVTVKNDPKPNPTKILPISLVLHTVPIRQLGNFKLNKLHGPWRNHKLQKSQFTHKKREKWQVQKIEEENIKSRSENYDKNNATLGTFPSNL